MKAVSLWQPWATAIALGSKRVETRDWSTSYRGLLAIHAAKRLHQGELIYYASCWNWCGALAKLGKRMGDGKSLRDLLPFGAIVATCVLRDCRPTESFTVGELETPRRPEGEASDMLDWTERLMGNFAPGRFGWVLEEVQPTRWPIPFTGRQGLFDVPDELLVRERA